MSADQTTMTNQHEGKRFIDIDTRGLPRWRENLAANLMIWVYRLIGAKVEVRDGR